MNPTPPKHIEAARNFLRLSIEDLQIAESIPKHIEGRNRMVCFLSQQAAEKALKAALASGCGCKEEVPRTHDLDELRRILPKQWKVHENNPDLHLLTEWAIKGRYGDECLDSPSSEDARTSLSIAKTAVFSIKEDCASIGIEAPTLTNRRRSEYTP